MSQPTLGAGRLGRAVLRTVAVTSFCPLAVLAACTSSPRASSRASPQTSGAASALPAPPVPSAAVDPEPPGTPLRYLAIGGGATPESTEVSIEQDIDRAERTLRGPGGVLFAGGPTSKSVREMGSDPSGDPLLMGLGELFDPRVGRTSRYREPRVGTGRSTLENVERWLSHATGAGTDPVLLYVAAHGDQGETPRDNAIVLWGGAALTVARLAELTEGTKRELRMIATSCYSGGFADLAFAEADERRGASKAKRCGLFAGTWDRQTSGCDANPDRRAQESYAIHFLHALSREDPGGKPLPPAEIDFDHDGAVSLLEAHTRARVASVSMDVPTTTSERWLRFVEKGRAPYGPDLLPEEQALVQRLGRALGLLDEAAVARRVSELADRLDGLNDRLDLAEKHLGQAAGLLSSRLLERWPVLDDPYHPDFAFTLQANRGSIRALLEGSREADGRSRAEREVGAIEDELDALEVEDARVERLHRSYENLHAAAALERRGDAAWKHYLWLLTCERGLP